MKETYVVLKRMRWSTQLMKVTVEPDLCEANGLCVLAAPGVFDLIDDDVVDILVPEPPPDMESAVADAVMACPKQALRLLAD
jgi:ferredoxin